MALGRIFPSRGVGRTKRRARIILEPNGGAVRDLMGGNLMILSQVFWVEVQLPRELMSGERHR